MVAERGFESSNAISPNDPLAVRLDELGYTDVGDSLEDMKQRAKDRDFQFPYLFDGETQQTSLAYGVLATPHVYLFDGERKLRYTGRIDDSDVKTVTSHDTRNALDAAWNRLCSITATDRLKFGASCDSSAIASAFAPVCSGTSR